MKANLIILILLLVAVAGAIVVMAVQLSAPSVPDEDSSKQVSDQLPAAPGGQPTVEDAGGNTGGGTPSESDGASEPTEENGDEQPEPPESADNGEGVEEPVAETPLDRFLKRFHEHQGKIKWMRADLTMTRFGIFSDPVDTDEQKKKAGRTSTGEFLYKPGNRFVFTMKYEPKGESDKKESERYLAYMHVLWIIKTTSPGKSGTGDTVKAERWLIDNEKMSEILMVLHGAVPGELKKIFEMRLVELGDSAEAARLKREGHDVDDLRARDVYLLELIYKNKVKRGNYKHIEVVINRDMEVEKVKLYNAFNDDETIIWFENIEINEGEEIPDSEFRFNPAKEGVEKFDDNATLEGAADILWRMRRTSEWVKGIEAKFERDKYDATWAGSGEAHSKSAGTLNFMRPDKFRLEVTKPEEQIIAGNGEKAYTYRKDLARAKLYDVKSAQKKLPVGDLRIMQKFFGQSSGDLSEQFEFVPQGVDKIDGVECYHLTLKPLPAAAGGKMSHNVDHIELWVELETFLARNIRIYDLQRKDNYNEVTLSDINIWKEIPKEKFDPVFPDGVEIIEE
ncbi:MAG: hypothetical protein DRP79_01195 [Planctomycetota bacterium]|nr:MAG: hypothetical protein DRP79_01195 [Planctomycetota bacterium]